MYVFHLELKQHPSIGRLVISHRKKKKRLVISDTEYPKDLVYTRRT